MFAVTISTRNAAFADAPYAEVARLLRELADTVENEPRNVTPWRLRDVNGNRIGFAVFTEAEVEEEEGP